MDQDLQNQIQLMINQTLKSSFTQKRVGDTPTDALQLTPKKYVDTQIANSKQLSYWTDTGSANTYVITPSPAITAYVTGQIFAVKIANTSTGQSTLNVNGLGTKVIKKIDGNIDITRGDLVAGVIYILTFDGINFQTQVPTQRVRGFLTTAANAGAITTTTNFKPRKFSMSWLYQVSTTGSPAVASGYGYWVAGAYAEVFMSNSAASSGNSSMTLNGDTTGIVSGAAANNTGNFSGAIGNLTDTTFDLTMTNTTGATPTIYVIWEAES